MLFRSDASVPCVPFRGCFILQKNIINMPVFIKPSAPLFIPAIWKIFPAYFFFVDKTVLYAGFKLLIHAAR